MKDCLKSAELFNLKDGLNSTPLEKRKSEFTEESKTKAARRADIIIYINPEIIIPIEVERHENIDAGLGQLLQYQADIDKKYGILTDGYRWRFYNNAYLLKEFKLDEIFSDPELFIDFWKEYTKPEFYYLSFFEERGQLKLLPSDLLVEKRRQDFFNAITTLIRGFKNKLKIEGYFKDFDKKEQEKKAIEITYAYIIQFILYKTLVDNDFGKFKKEFEEKVEAIQECLKAKQYGKILAIIEEISNTISKNIYRPFAKEQKFITGTLYDLIHKPKNDLHDVSPWLDIFVFIKNYNFANVKNEILYLLSLFNSSIIEKVLKSNLKSEHEKGYLISTTSIKQFVRIPIITEDNQFIKDEIIKKTDEMLALEDIALADLIDFSGVMIQKFDDMEVAGDNLVLEKDGKQIKCKIKKDKNLVEKTIKDISENKKLFKEKQIILSELKSLPAIDFEKQKEIKDYIDDLGFVLYFGIPIKKVGIERAKEIKGEYEKSRFYKLIKKYA